MHLEEKLEKKATQTYLEFGANQLRALCEAMGFEEKTQEAVEQFRCLFSPWGETTMGSSPRRPCYLTADFTPFHFSLALYGQRSELRVAFEPQGADGTLESQQEAGYAQIERLASDFGLSLERFREIEGLFLPENPKGEFSIWLAAPLGPNRTQEPDLQVYFDCQAQGREKAPLIVEEALHRLGFGRAWPVIAEVLARREPDKTVLNFFSLDLTKDKTARVKVYVQHIGATAQQVETALSIVSKYVPGDATELVEAITGDREPFLDDREDNIIGSHYAFVEGDEERPSGAVFFFTPHLYLPNDQVVCDRICTYLAKNNLPSSLYESSVKAFAARPLEEGLGLQSFISIKREKGERRVTVYWTPEAYKVYPPQVGTEEVRLFQIGHS